MCCWRSSDHVFSLSWKSDEAQGLGEMGCFGISGKGRWFDLHSFAANWWHEIRTASVLLHHHYWTSRDVIRLTHPGMTNPVGCLKRFFSLLQPSITETTFSREKTVTFKHVWMCVCIVLFVFNKEHSPAHQRTWSGRLFVFKPVVNQHESSNFNQHLYSLKQKVRLTP